MLQVQDSEIFQLAIMPSFDVAENSGRINQRIQVDGDSFSELAIFEVPDEDLTFSSAENASAVWDASPLEHFPVEPAVETTDSYFLNKSAFVLFWIESLAHAHEDGHWLRSGCSLHGLGQGDSVGAFVNLLHPKEFSWLQKAEYDRNRA